MTLNLDGLIPATVLPMHADGSIDEPALRSYIGWVANQGPVALAINVDTGEGPHLTHDEKVRIIKVVRDVTDLPIVAGLNFEPDTLRAMAAVEGVVAIKEASFDARRFVDTARLLEELPRPITLLTGNDNFILESFMLGATGALIGFGAVMTREQVDMIAAWQEGRIEDAKALGRRVQRLADVVFAAPVGDYRVRLKECLRILGVLEAAHVRRPLQPLGDAERAHLAAVLGEVGLLHAPEPTPVAARA
jgi:dihydrodipicolinate synthase/N-acetylneuraminate lyase